MVLRRLKGQKAQRTCAADILIFWADATAYSNPGGVLSTQQDLQTISKRGLEFSRETHEAAERLF
jgi:hypothetical protein